MIFSTEGILLKREPIKDLSEKLIFFTKDLGKIIIYAFGTRSINSIRGKILGSFEWVNLELEKTKGRYVLKELSLCNKNVPEPYWQDKDFVLDLSKLFSEFAPKIPFEAKVEELYELLKILTCNPVASYPRSYRVFSFYHSVLCELGIMPDWSGCGMCGEHCSNNYHFEFKDGGYTATGLDCLGIPAKPNRLTQIAETPQRIGLGDTGTNPGKAVDETILHLRLEELYFLHYATIHYKPKLDFFNATFDAIKKFGQSDYVFVSPKLLSHSPRTTEQDIKYSFLPTQVDEIKSSGDEQIEGAMLKINWQTIIRVLEKVLRA